MKTNAWFVNCADFRDSDVAIEFSFQKKEQVRTCKNEKEKWVGARQSIRLVLLKEEIDGPNRRQLPEKYKWYANVCNVDILQLCYCEVFKVLGCPAYRKRKMPTKSH